VIPLVERYSNKQISFSFSGAKLKINLSQGLFSSFDIDSGTKLLLKTLARNADLENVTRIADIGCGTGVIGIALVKKLSGIRCVFQDRDALALAFAKSNAELNGVGKRSSFSGGLGFQRIEEEAFDLIVSNLPAKVGRPVLLQIINEMLERLSSDGTACVVVVLPLADEIGGFIRDLGAEILYTEDGREHRVYHFRRGGEILPASGTGDHLAAYVRHRGSFSHSAVPYDLETVYNLPDFDTLGWDAALSMDLIYKRLEYKSGGVLVWNPGQGHVPVFLSKYYPESTPERFVLASRDALQLEISRRNLLAARSTIRPDGTAAPEPATHHVPSMDALCGSAVPGSVSLAVLFPHPVPGADWQDEAAQMLDRVLESGGSVVACAGSTVIHRFLSALHGMVLHGSRKYHGSRAVLLKKSS
jgi:SAM-dependent methyltransferase